MLHILGEGTVKERMVGMGSKACELHPSVYWHGKRWIIVVAHLDAFLSTGSVDSVSWLFDTLGAQGDLKRHIYSQTEIKHLMRAFGRVYQGSSGDVIRRKRGCC